MKLKRGNYAQKQVGVMLAEISEDTHQAGLPLLSSIVINADTKQPGDGFYDLAVSLGKISPGLIETQRVAFWEAEVARVFAASWPSSAISLKPKS